MWKRILYKIDVPKKCELHGTNLGVKLASCLNFLDIRGVISSGLNDLKAWSKSLWCFYINNFVSLNLLGSISNLSTSWGRHSQKNLASSLLWCPSITSIGMISSCLGRKNSHFYKDVFSYSATFHRNGRQ